jgi:hypothetical protein
MFDNYHLTRKNASYHLLILHGPLWGGRFQMAATGKRQLTAREWQDSIRPKSIDILWLWKVFGPVISFGSYIDSPILVEAASLIKQIATASPGFSKLPRQCSRLPAGGL